jgi:ERCC4-type nuclease
MVLLIERKTPSDLMSSIKDGRYNEQSYRLNGLDIQNHNIIYLIEGNFNMHKDRNIIMSSMFSLFYYKGFSVWQSSGTIMTKQLIQRFTSKLEKEFGKKSGHYSESRCHKSDLPVDTYVNCIKSVKKDNITVNNIHEIMLCQIPHVSSTIAKVLIQRYKTIFDLYDEIKKDVSCLSNIKYKVTGDKERKISSLATNNIVKYFTHKEINEDL